MKNFMLLCAVCFANAASAQLLIQTDILPEAGENFASHVVSNATSLDPGSGGLSASWDLSNAHYSLDSFKVKYSVVASGTPHAAMFPSANFAMKSYDNFDPMHVSYNYYLLDTNLHYYYLGTKGGALTQVYSNPIEQFHFPFGYNNTAYDPFCFESTGGGSTFDYCGNTMLHFDGVGSLTLPYGSFNGVYRLRMERFAVDQASNDTSFTTIYYWYKPGIHHPLATYESFTGSDGVTVVTASLLSQFVTSVNNVVRDQSANVFPNPFHQAVNITLDVESVVSIFTMEGKQLHEIKMNAGKQTIDLSQHPAGVFMLCVDNGVSIKRQVVVKE